MRSIHIADVGDGLCIGVRIVSGETVQIDCGSQQGGKAAFKGLKRTLYKAGGGNVFVLSHFHIDHYNGLLHACFAKTHQWRRFPAIREAYYPRIPDFDRKKEFVLCLFAMNLRVFGSETGVMEYDFLRAISRMNGGQRFKYRPLCQGDIIDVGGTVLEALWPPKVMEDDRALSAVRRALEDFKRAMEEDEKTRYLYERVADAGVSEEYLEDHEGIEKLGEKEDLEISQEPEWRSELPEVVTKANESLRKAANHMGLALFEDNRLLFLGDLEDFEIREVVHSLDLRGRRRFYVLITPHHGTHWDESLKGIQCLYSVSSVGRRLCSRTDPRFKKISEIPLATWMNGDIMLPAFQTGGIWPRSGWWCPVL